MSVVFGDETTVGTVSGPLDASIPVFINFVDSPPELKVEKNFANEFFAFSNVPVHMRALSIYDDDFPTLVTENIGFVSVDVTASSGERIEYEQY